MSALRFARVTPGLYQAQRGDQHYELDCEQRGQWILNYGTADAPQSGLTKIGEYGTRKQATQAAAAHYVEVTGG